MQHSGGVIAGIAAADGIAHDGLAQVAVRIAAAHALVNGVLQQSAHDVCVLPDLGIHHRHARILTDGHALLAGDAGILTDQTEGFLCGDKGLGFMRAFEHGLHASGQMGAGLNAQPGHGSCDGFTGDFASLHAKILLC